MAWSAARASEPPDAIVVTASAGDRRALGERLRLAPGRELNLRGAAPLFRVRATRVSLTGSIDNLADAVITPQAELPLAGRIVRIGLRATQL